MKVPLTMAKIAKSIKKVLEVMVAAAELIVQTP